MNLNHVILSNNYWIIIDYGVDIHLYIYTLIIVIVGVFRRKKLVNIFPIIISAFITFKLWDIYFGFTHLFMLLRSESVFWLSLKDVQSDICADEFFPAEHIGGLVVFSFAINELFFKNKFWIEFIVLLTVVLIYSKNSYDS